MKIRDVMVHDVVKIDPSASLAEAAQLMREANVGMLPVVDDGQVCGVITDRDLVARAIAAGAISPRRLWANAPPAIRSSPIRTGTSIRRWRPWRGPRSGASR